MSRSRLPKQLLYFLRKLREVALDNAPCQRRRYLRVPMRQPVSKVDNAASRSDFGFKRWVNLNRLSHGLTNNLELTFNS